MREGWGDLDMCNIIQYNNDSINKMIIIILIKSNLSPGSSELGRNLELH